MDIEHNINQSVLKRACDSTEDIIAGKRRKVIISRSFPRSQIEEEVKRCIQKTIILLMNAQLSVYRKLTYDDDENENNLEFEKHKDIDSIHGSLQFLNTDSSWSSYLSLNGTREASETISLHTIIIGDIKISITSAIIDLDTKRKKTSFEIIYKFKVDENYLKYR